MIAVVGAGPAGLAAAWRAALAGHEVTVFEAADRVGGMAASFDVAGVRVDHGSHRLHPATDPGILAALRQLIGAELQTRPRRGRIRVAGRWCAFPLRPRDLAGTLPPAFAARAAFDLLTGRLRRAADDSFAEAVRAGLGPTVARAVYEPYIRKLWGVDGDTLTAELARRRVPTRSSGAVMRRLTAGPSSFLYPRTGFGAIADAVAGAAVDAGATIRTGSAVERIDLTAPDAVSVVLAGGARVDATAVWSTAPAATLVRLVEPVAPGGVADAASDLRHRALVLVYVVLKGRPYTPFDAHYIPEAGIPVSRVSEPANYRDNPDDPPDHTVLCAEVPCTVGDPTWASTDDDLGVSVTDALARVRLPVPSLLAVETRRLPRVYPVYTPEAAWAAASVDLWASSHPRLLVLGRQGLFVPDNTHHALAMGWAAAASVLSDGTVDRDRWARARAGFRSHVVED